MARRFSERLRLHNENPRTNHLPPHDALSLGMHISEEDVMLFACISTPFMLLAPAYAIEAQLCVELNGDCTGGFVQEFVDLLAFVVPDCRGSFHVWGTALTPDKCESEQFFTQFYILLLKGFNHMLKDFIPCGESTCRFCTEVCRIREFPEIVKLLRGRTAPTPFSGDMIQLTQIPWNVGTGDPGYGFQNFVRKFLGIESNVCFTHFGPIGAKYGHHAKKSDAKYRKGEFREHILAISKLTNQGVARIAQAKFVDYLRNERKDKTGADWVAKEWTGPIKGRYTKADSGMPFLFR